MLSRQILHKNAPHEKCSAKMHQPQDNGWVVMGERFDVSNRFRLIDYLGAGAYGTVCAAFDNIEGTTVAIKKCKGIFQSRTLAKRTLREMRILRQLRHQNVVKLKFVLPQADVRPFSDVYMVFEIMDTDLAQIIRSPQRLKQEHVQYFTYQLLLALDYLHSHHIIHRDVKPRNLLVNADCRLKLADFGLARMLDDETPLAAGAVMTDYVTTRWYRAPEVIVGWGHYSGAIDMWGVGCIVAELIMRMPLFPGENTVRQMEIIMRILGRPTDEFIKNSQKPLHRQSMRSRRQQAAGLRSVLPFASRPALDLIAWLLMFDPGCRPTAQQCLDHAYIAPMSSAISPPIIEPLVGTSTSFAFDRGKPSIEELRFEVLKEMQYYSESAIFAAKEFSSPEKKTVASTAANEEDEGRELRDHGSSNEIDGDVRRSSFCQIDSDTKEIAVPRRSPDESIVNSGIKDNSLCETTLEKMKYACTNISASNDCHGNQIDLQTVTKRDVVSTSVFADDKHHKQGHRRAYSASDIPIISPSTAPPVSRASFRFFPCTEAVGSDDEVVNDDGNEPKDDSRIKDIQVQEEKEIMHEDAVISTSGRAMTETHLLRRRTHRLLPPTPSKRSTPSITFRRCSIM